MSESSIAFDTGRARSYRPRDTFTKTAVLVVPARANPIFIRAPFGEQQMRGPFYAVADADGSYGAAKEEFERTHRRVGPAEWVKSEPVLAYRASERCRVSTEVGGGIESTTVAEPGDWIVQQATGEVMVVAPAEFDARYVDAEE